MRTPRADAVPPRIMVLCCPQLCGPDAGPQAARWFERVITTVTGFCPDVEVAEPGVCAFGARGPARYFGGEAVLAAKIITAVAELGVESRIGVADGVLAAQLGARAATPAGPAPVIPPRGRGGRVPGGAAGARPRRPGSGRGAQAARPRHARRPGRAAGRRCGQPVRRRGRKRAPAGPRPGLPAAGGPAAGR